MVNCSIEMCGTSKSDTNFQRSRALNIHTILAPFPSAPVIMALEIIFLP